MFFIRFPILVLGCNLFGNILAYGLHPENITETKKIEAYFANLYGGAPRTCSVLSSSTSRNGILNENFRWTDFKVYLDPEYDDLARILINNAMTRLEDILPCVKFTLLDKEDSPDGDYIHVIRRGGCSSGLGRQGGRQTLTLANGCLDMGRITHEFMHALGLHHEQCRSDRDDYVTVLLENITPGMEYNFIKTNPQQFSAYGVQYNTESIMHYGSFDFSAAGKPTIETKDGKTFVWSGEVQETDILKLRRMYNCYNEDFA